MSRVPSIRWLLDAYPRTPKRTGLLMRLYYIWQEYFMPAGHSAFALLFISMVAGLVPGFWVAWFFCGLDFLLFLTLAPSLFMTCRKNKFEAGVVEVSPVFEGEPATVQVRIMAKNRIDAAALSCFRMDTSLVSEELPYMLVNSGESVMFQCKVRTQKRGAFTVGKVSLLVPEIMGMLRYSAKVGSAEILVYPRPISISAFDFLTWGSSGLVFAPLLTSGFARGLDFSGVREYQEGDALRDLHHKAFARYGRPFTKEFEAERGAGIVLVLDVCGNTMSERYMLERLIRLAAGVGAWFMERGILGRFFVGDEEIPLNGSDGGDSLFAALARIPAANPFRRGSSGDAHAWSPAARPMGPVLRLGLHREENPLVHKQIIVCAEAAHEQFGDDTLFVHHSLLKGKISLNRQEDLLL